MYMFVGTERAVVLEALFAFAEDVLCSWLVEAGRAGGVFVG
jgi:hypothetical protein